LVLVTGGGGRGLTRRKKSVRIESLFIDEGFGTLDPETLDIDPDPPEGLRQGNKSIGVIPHVGLLKERISTQIVVHKSSSGHSTLQTLPA
jgi:DNA repair protein SbcC/Rad50